MLLPVPAAPVTSTYTAGTGVWTASGAIADVNALLAGVTFTPAANFNGGTTPARYLAFKHEVVSIRNAQGVPKAWISRRVGGDQIDYADEIPIVRKMFTDELAKNGLTPRMDQAYAQELADLPPPIAKSA